MIILIHDQELNPVALYRISDVMLEMLQDGRRVRIALAPETMHELLPGESAYSTTIEYVVIELLAGVYVGGPTHLLQRLPPVFLPNQMAFLKTYFLIDNEDIATYGKDAYRTLASSPTSTMPKSTLNKDELIGVIGQF
jgi:hypothetical protein